MKVRHDVWNLPSTDETLLWYGRAVGEMAKRPVTDPTSWRFQAAVHGQANSSDPFYKKGQKLPTPSTRATFWNRCQHGTWYFLPWHRMYLYYFEQMVAAEVAKLGGPSDWTLPYWNYSETMQARLLPEGFRNPTMPDGSPNNLYVAQRTPAANAGQQFMQAADIDLGALAQSLFSNSTDGGFGGIPTAFSHSGSSFGQLENTPHNHVHVAVGNKGAKPFGWMIDPNTAALDPIFWLHHANIDRLWVVWLNQNSQHQNPTSLQWLHNITFKFYDANSHQAEMRCSEVVDTTPLGYTYEEDGSHAVAAAPAVLGVPAAPEAESSMAKSIPPELMGATQTSFQIKDTPIHINVPMPLLEAARKKHAQAAAEATPGTLSAEAAPEPRVLLQLENITSRELAGSYDVYVNVPEGQEPSQHPELFAGRLGLFGIVNASLVSDAHAGSGLTFTLDITKIYNLISTQPGWDPNNIRVSLVPATTGQEATVTIGRVSLFFG